MSLDLGSTKIYYITYDMIRVKYEIANFLYLMPDRNNTLTKSIKYFKYIKSIKESLFVSYLNKIIRLYVSLTLINPLS